MGKIPDKIYLGQGGSVMWSESKGHSWCIYSGVMDGASSWVSPSNRDQQKINDLAIAEEIVRRYNGEQPKSRCEEIFSAALERLDQCGRDIAPAIFGKELEKELREILKAATTKETT